MVLSKSSLYNYILLSSCYHVILILENNICYDNVSDYYLSPIDSILTGDCLCPTNQTGGLCQSGYYCPMGSYEPIPCPEGKYCDDTGLGVPAGDCDPGYYCSLAAVRPDPIDPNTGGLCPEGRYCGMT